jgi:hypothetical protein
MVASVVAPVSAAYNFYPEAAHPCGLFFVPSAHRNPPPRSPNIVPAAIARFLNVAEGHCVNHAEKIVPVSAASDLRFAKVLLRVLASRPQCVAAAAMSATT